MSSICEQRATDGVYLRTKDGKEFKLPAASFPAPTNPHDRYEVEQKVQAMIDKFADGGFVCHLHVHRLEPLEVSIISGDPPPIWWRRTPAA